MRAISRRHLLAAGVAAPVAGAVADVVAGAAPAAASPILIVDPTVRRHGPVGLVGDSTCGGYVGGLRVELQHQDVGPFRCDIQPSRSIARSSRQFPSSIAAVRSARAAGFDPPAWVVAVGANDTWFIGKGLYSAGELIDDLLAAIGADRHVLFVNQWRTKPGSWPMLNTALLEAPARWPLLRVIDWAGVARFHPEWHGRDGTHFTGKGAIARNEFLARTMVSAADLARSYATRPRLAGGQLRLT